jgi:hypothetical protein
LTIEHFRKTSYERHVRWTVLAACLLVVGLAGGCFKPQVESGGFACSMTDNPPCPDNFFCVSGLCQDHPGVSTDQDLAIGAGGGGGGGSGGGGGGTVGPDMAMASVDMAHAPGDMATTACAMSGDDCSSTPCCAGSTCIPGFNICF